MTDTPGAMCLAMIICRNINRIEQAGEPPRLNLLDVFIEASTGQQQLAVYAALGITRNYTPTVRIALVQFDLKEEFELRSFNQSMAQGSLVVICETMGVDIRIPGRYGIRLYLDKAVNAERRFVVK